MADFTVLLKQIRSHNSCFSEIPQLKTFGLGAKLAGTFILLHKCLTEAVEW